MSWVCLLGTWDIGKWLNGECNCYVTGCICSALFADSVMVTIVELEGRLGYLIKS